MKIDARRMFTGRGLLVTAVAAGVLAGGGTTVAAAAAPDEPAASATPSDGKHDDRPEGGASKTAVSIAQAVDAALKASPGKIAEIELDDENGKTVWEADVVADNGDRREVTVDSGTGKVLTNRADDQTGKQTDEKADDRAEDDAELAALREAKVSASAATDAALKAAPGHATSAEFENEDGKAVWEVDVTGQDGAEHEITVDAATGKVLDNVTDKD
ncbi:PepSY domain-containing protein [Actinomadura chokoriensis]|uniref:PepSY domain-containing protein n=1 Tax=Actinomadura chokoriensis TaxID=454156 RepID=A0ABV4QWJ5_9ACTN